MRKVTLLVWAVASLAAAGVARADPAPAAGAAKRLPPPVVRSLPPVKSSADLFPPAMEIPIRSATPAPTAERPCPPASRPISAEIPPASPAPIARPLPPVAAVRETPTRVGPPVTRVPAAATRVPAVASRPAPPTRSSGGLRMVESRVPAGVKVVRSSPGKGCVT
jgi:hypothetical protein